MDGDTALERYRRRPLIGSPQSELRLARAHLDVWRRLGVWSLAAVSQACSPASASSDCGWLFTGKVEVLTWWQIAECGKQCQESAYDINNENRRPDAEADAVNVVQVAHDRCGNNRTGATPLVVTNLESPNELRSQVDAGVPDANPDSTTLVHLNAGSDVWSFAGCKDLTKRKLAPLGTWQTSPLTERIPPILRDKVSCRDDPSGAFYAVPVGIHRLNVLIYNRDVLDRHDLKPEELVDFPAFLAALHNIEVDDGTQLPKVKPIVVPGDLWPMSLLLAENVMLAVVGKEAFEAHWEWKANGETSDGVDLPPPVQESLAAMAPFVHLPDCEDGSGEACSRADAIEEVKRGRAAFTVMGDWVIPDLKDSPHVGAMPFPGTKPYFVYTADVLAVPTPPAGLDPNDAAFGVLKSVTSAGTQQEYSVAKHSRAITRDSNGRSVFNEEGVLFDGIPVPSLTLFAKTDVENKDFQERLGELVETAIPPQNTPFEPLTPPWKRPNP